MFKTFIYVCRPPNVWVDFLEKVLLVQHLVWSPDSRLHSTFYLFTKALLTSKIDCYQIMWPWAVWRPHFSTQTHPVKLSPVGLFQSSLPATGLGSNNCQLSESQSHKRLTSQRSQGSSLLSRGSVCVCVCACVCVCGPHGLDINM